MLLASKSGASPSFCYSVPSLLHLCQTQMLRSTHHSLNTNIYRLQASGCTWKGYITITTPLRSHFNERETVPTLLRSRPPP